MAHLSLTFLGSFQATLGDKPLANFRSARVQGLLIYLALTDQQPHPRDVLAAFFWPDEPEAVAKKNLRQSLYQLRQVLDETAAREESFLLVTRSTLQFNPASDYDLDVTACLTCLENDQLEQAAALYRGELLSGFTCDSLPFEEWLRQERERLHRLALDALFELTARNLAQADYRTAQNLARRQLALEPWREEAHRQLMQALALFGPAGRSAALAQYEACRVALAQELGLEPAAETEALAAHIRDQQVEPDEQQEPVPPLERRRLTTPFIGRNGEYEALVRAYRQAGRGDAQVVTLLGEAGIGKTRLAQHFLDWAATQGADILRGRAFETSGRLSYQPLTQLLRQRLERENAPDDLLSDLWLTQLTRILPELSDRYPDLPEPTQEKATARQHLFEAITRLGQALAERAPLVIFIDDWHWADAASLDVLHYAALRWLEERASIMVLLTLRQGAVTESPELQTWLTRLKHDVACTQLNLAALSGTETEQLIRTLLQPEEGDEAAPPGNVEKLSPLASFSRWLFEETDGQPFFLVETLKALVETGLIWPDTGSPAWRIDWPRLDQQALESGGRILPGVREIIRGWLDRISASAGKLLTAAAVLGQAASFDHLCRVAGLEEIQALTALDELLTRQLLLEADEPGRELTYSFSHQKLGEVVYAEAGAARRRMLHRRAFQSLQAAAAPAAELVHHALNAGLRTETIQYSIVAGNAAMRLFATRVAITHYQTACQLAEQMGWPEAISGADRQDLYASLGRAYELVEAWPRAQETYQAMIAYAQAIEAPAIECLGLNRLATVYTNGFKEPQQAITLLKQAQTVAEQSGDRRGLAETEWNLSIATRMQHQIQLARQHGEQALAIARQLGHPQLLARCLNSLAYVHCFLRHWAVVEIYADEARELYAAAGDRILEADSQRLAGWSQMYAGRPQDSLATLQETFAFSQQIENLWGQAECAWRLAGTLLELGRYGEAIRLARQAVKQTRMVGQPTMVVMALSTWGTVQRTLMAPEAARETLLEALAESTGHGLTGFGDWPLAELGALHALVGDWGQANAYARQTLQVRDDESLLPMGSTGWYETEALLRGGDDNLARTAVERLGKIVGNNRRYRLPLLRSLAVLAQWDGDIEQAITHLQAAAALAQEIGLPGEEWSILSALGALYADQGDQAKAQQARNASTGIILRLAETIDEEDLRAGFLAAGPVRPILEMSEPGLK